MRPGPGFELGPQLDARGVIDAIQDLHDRIDSGDDRVLQALLAITKRLDEQDQIIAGAVMRAVVNRLEKP